MTIKQCKRVGIIVWAGTLLALAAPAVAQLIDKNKAPNIANEGISKTLSQQIGAGRGDRMTPDSSSFIIARDPFRSIRRGRQLFQRKFTRDEGQGPVINDGVGDINSNLAIGAGLSDSCASCHGRPRGAAGAGGDVVTRPDSRDAPHLFGLGLKEMLADEITSDLRLIRAQAIADALADHHSTLRLLVSKGISYGTITANPDGTVSTSNVQGVGGDLRVRPFFHHGGTISIREFVVGALNNEMGLQAVDPDLTAAVNGARVTTPAGMVLDGSLDTVEGPLATSTSDDPDGDGKVNEVPVSLVDHLEFYLLNYFKPATYEQTASANKGRRLFEKIGCAQCHIPDLQIDRDRRVADVETTYDASKGIFNNLFATVSGLFTVTDDGLGFPALKSPRLQPFLVRNIFADFKLHDLGRAFYERNYDGTTRTQFITTPLWGVGTTAPYGHDGRSINLAEVILRHGGEAESARSRFASLPGEQRSALLEFLNSLVLFPPDDTASTLDPGNRNAPGFPQFQHGSLKLTVLFNNPADVE
jgi:hypothetical protein